MTVLSSSMETVISRSGVEAGVCTVIIAQADIQTTLEKFQCNKRPWGAEKDKSPHASLPPTHWRTSGEGPNCSALQHLVCKG